METKRREEAVLENQRKRGERKLRSENNCLEIEGRGCNLRGFILPLVALTLSLSLTFYPRIFHGNQRKAYLPCSILVHARQTKARLDSFENWQNFAP